MSIEWNKRTVLRYYEEVLNRREASVLDELAVPDYVEHDPFPGQGDGLPDLRRRVELLHGAFAPCRFNVQDVIAEGDRVVVRWRSAGTHSGEFLGLPPTFREYEINGVDIHRLVDGRMAEHWHVVDQFGQLLQLGLLAMQPQPA